jgi:superfamily II DNA helicase RecQ
MSATLTGRVQRDVLKKLHFPPTDYIKLNMGNERPNVSLTMRMIENSLNSLTDLDFIVPRGIQNVDDIPKTFVYADNIVSGIDIEDYLTERLPENMWGLGMVRCYNAAFSSDYRKAVMDLFKQGRIRILICTDAAGMVRFF